MAARIKKVKARRFRYVVKRDQQGCSLFHIDGLYKTAGILLPSRHHEPATIFRSQDSAFRAIDRTKNAGRRLRSSLVSEFIFKRCPDLQPLFDEKAYFEVREVETNGK